MVMMICSSEPFSKCLQCIFALSPLTSDEFAVLLANIKCGHVVYAFGVLSCKESNGEVLMMCCATHVIKVCSPEPGSSKSFVCNNFSFSASENCCSSSLSNLVPCLLQFFFSKSAPTYCHMCVAGFQHLLHLRVSNSPTLLRLRNHRFTFMVVKCLLCFDDHAMITCYLHIHKAQTKPLQCK